MFMFNNTSVWLEEGVSFKQSTQTSSNKIKHYPHLKSKTLTFPTFLHFIMGVLNLWQV